MATIFNKIINKEVDADIVYDNKFVIAFKDILPQAPIHILIGELDDWVTASACEDLVADMQDEDVNIEITVYPNAHHGFDRRGPLVTADRAYATGDCHFRRRADGALLMNFLNIPMTTPLRQKIALGLCADRGTTIGGNVEARRASFEFARSFMTKYLDQ